LDKSRSEQTDKGFWIQWSKKESEKGKKMEMIIKKWRKSREINKIQKYVINYGVKKHKNWSERLTLKLPVKVF